MPVLRLERTCRLVEASRQLLQYADRITSQYGEDGILRRIFSLLGEGSRWCCELGAGDGIDCSNTHSLLAQGWRGVLIEPDAVKFTALQTTYRSRSDLCLIQAGAGPGLCRLDDLLATTPAPRALDLLSLDIDGTDWYCWQDLEHYRPRVVVVEHNQSCPNDVYFVQDPDPQIHQGSSPLALVELGLRKGYELACCTVGNCLFVVREEFSKLGVEDNRLEALYEPSLDGRVFHGYDGTVYQVGMDHLIWHRRTVGATELQVLPRHERYYGSRPLEVSR